MKLEDLSRPTRSWMELMGSFGPTVKPEDRQIKGYLSCAPDEDGSTYYDSGELRELAAACTEVADWLDKRAKEAKQ